MIVTKLGRNTRMREDFGPGAEYSHVDREPGKAGVPAPTTHRHLPQRHPRPVYVQAEVTTTHSSTRMQFSSKCHLPFETTARRRKGGASPEDPPVADGGRQ